MKRLRLPAILFSFLMCFILVFQVLPMGVGTVAAATPIYVNASAGSDDYDGEAAVWNGTHGPKATIQAGINVVDTGGTVNVAAGTYVESLGGWRDIEVFKSLSLIGAGSATTTVLMSDLQHGVEIRPDASGTVLIQGIAFTKYTYNTTSAGWGVIVGETGGTFASLAFRDVEIAYASARNLHLAASATYGNVEITNCNIHDAGAWGASVSGSVTAMSVTNSHCDENGWSDPTHGIGLDIDVPSIGSLTVMGGTFNGNQAKGINLRNTTDATFTNITASNNGGAPGGGEGVCVWEYSGTTSNLVFNNPTLSNNTLDGLLIGCETGKTVSGVTITGGTMTCNGRAGVFVYREAGWCEGVIENIDITGASIGGNVAGVTVVLPYETVDAMSNWWGDSSGPYHSTNPAGSGNAVSDSVSFDPWMTSSAAEVWVDDDFDCSTPGWMSDHFATIGDGIDAVSAAGTVSVAAGTYVEQLDILKNLTLSGAGAGTTTVLCPDVLATKFTTSTANKPVVYVSGAAAVTIEGLTVDGDGKGNVNSRMEGIAYFNAGGTVQNCEIKDICETPLSGSQQGIGIYVYNGDSAARTVNVSGNDIYGYQKNGMALVGAGLTANVTGNTVTGAGPTGVIAQNGIQISYGASGIISGNAVSGNYWTGTYGGTNDPISDPEADGAAGICLYGSNSVTVQGNSLTSNQFGLWSVAGATLDIQSNTITGAADQGYAFVTGIAVWDSDMWTADLLPSPVSTVASISNSNVITSTHYGLLIMDYTLDDGYQPDVAANGNDISGNSGYGAWANVAVDATLNWWGDASGPSGAGPGTGDAVSANVSFIPWTGMVTTPIVSSVTPNQGTQGQILTGVVIGGTYLTGASAVGFGAGITVNSYTVDSDTQIRANITIGATATIGARDITVTTSAGTGTMTGGFTVTAYSGPIGTPSLVSPANGASVAGASVTYEWSAVAGAVDYRLVVSTSTNPFDATKRKISILVGNVTTCVDTGYPATGTKYYWWVWACAADGSVSPWAQVSANRREFTSVPSIGAPALISPANGASVPGASVTFEWSPTTGAVKYKLLVSTSTNIMDTSKYKRNVDLVDEGSGLPTTYIDTAYPANNTKYYWWVWAYAADGSSSLWAQVSANRREFTNTPSVGAPALVSPANNAAVLGTSVTFEWSSVTGAVDYKLVVSTSTNILDATKYKCNVNVGNVTGHTDTGYPANGTVYYWWVWAYDSGGAPSLWAQVSANRRTFTNIPIEAPALMSPASGASVPGTSVTFGWGSVPGAAKYKLLVSTSTNILDATKYKCNIDLVGEAATTYVDTGYPANGTVYYWWVWAYDANGNASLWAQVSANMRSFTSVA